MNDKSQVFEKGALDFSAEIDYARMNEFIDIIADRYPFLSVTSIGQTVLGKRIPLISVGRGKKSVIYIGGQAGGESQSVSVLLRFINELCGFIVNNGRFYNCSAAYFFATRTIIVVPMLNPDGINFFRYGVENELPIKQDLIDKECGRGTWKGNARGINLKQNFGKRFDDIITLEPESGALRNYLMFNRDIKLAISLCKGQNSIVCTHRGSTPPRLTAIGNTIARSMFCDYFCENGNGTICDFCSEELVIPSFEIRSSYSYGRNCFEDYCRQREALFLAPTII